MRFELRFEILHRYPSGESGITVPLQIMAGWRSVHLTAKLDTGAAFCVFCRECGEELGLAIEAGLPLKLATPTGAFRVYGHEVTLIVLGITLETTVYFAGHAGFHRNVLGQQGWLDRIRLGLVDYESKLYLSRY